MGLDGRDPSAAYWARLFGIRDMALAAGLALSRGEDRRRWRALAIVSDAGDAFAGEMAARESNATGLARWALPGAPVAVVALGIAGLLTDSD